MLWFAIAWLVCLGLIAGAAAWDNKSKSSTKAEQ